MQTSRSRKQTILLTLVFVFLISASVFAGKPADTDTSSTITVNDVTKRSAGTKEMYVLQNEFISSHDGYLSYGIHSVNGTGGGKSLVFEYDYSKSDESDDQLGEISDYVIMGEQMVVIKKGFTGEIVLRVYTGNIAGPKKFVLITILPNDQETPSAAPAITPAETPSVQVVSSLPKPALKSVKNSKKGRVSVTWKKLSAKQKKKVQKIEVECAGPDGVKTTKYVSKKKTSIILKGLKKGKTYTIRVRTVKGKTVSKWSRTKKVKIRK